MLRGPDSDRSIAYLLRTSSPDLTLSAAELGALKVRRGAREVFTIPAPIMLDSGGRVSLENTYRVERVGEQAWEVHAILDQAWLDGVDRAWPVTVDPSIIVETYTNQECQRFDPVGAPGGVPYCGMGHGFVGVDPNYNGVGAEASYYVWWGTAPADVDHAVVSARVRAGLNCSYQASTCPDVGLFALTGSVNDDGLAHVSTPLAEWSTWRTGDVEVDLVGIRDSPGVRKSLARELDCSVLGR